MSELVQMGIFRTETTGEQQLPREIKEAFENRIRESNVNLHGYLMARGDGIIAERYYKPFCADSEHRMYSVAKSFTSLAIGLLEAEGKLSLSDAICDYFPDKLPEEGAHPYIQAMTIRDMLRMATAHKSTTYKRTPGDDWVGSFFRTEPDHMPGTLFSYDTSSALVLAALAERLSGMELLSYLREKVLDEIGFSKEAKFLKAPMGESQGGSGLICTLHDMASVLWLCANKGRFHGKQLLPERYLEAATAKQISTSLQPVVDEQQGYGYLFWRTRHNGFCMYGMGGQLALAFPEQDFLFATIADTQGSPAGLQALYDTFYQTVFPFVCGQQEWESRQWDWESRLQERKNGQQEWENGLSGKEVPEEELIETSSSLFAIPPLKTEKGTVKNEDVSRFCGVTYRLLENPAGLERICLRMEESQETGKLIYEREGREHVLAFQSGGYCKQKFPGTDEPCIVTGAWEDKRTFAIRAWLIGEDFGHVFWNLGFTGDAVTVAMKRAGETLLKEYDGFAAGQKEKYK